METFYRFLGGPRTFWGGSNKVIINNFGGGPMFRPMARPVFVHHHCGGGLNRMFGFMAGMSLLSNLFGYNNQVNIGTSGMYNSYGNFDQYPQYTPYAGQTNYTDTSSLNSRLKMVEAEVKSIEKKIDDIKNAECDCNNKKVESNKTDKPEKTNTEGKVENTENTNSSEEVKAEDSTSVDKTKPANDTEDTKPKTIDEILNDIEGFDKLDSAQKDYVKKRIENAYTDENGNIKYDIKATVHDGDTMDAIINRFYTEQEQQELNVAQKEYNTQISGKKVKNPNSGDTINANGVSEHGLKALIEDAKQGITRDGEIQKTNKKMTELKEAFKKGDKKLSKEYVLQNHLMSEQEYNKIIKNKYSN